MLSLPRCSKNSGFTLAELLIALLIVGEIATFTIPKVITSQQNNTYNARAKEAAATVAAAYQKYLLTNGASTSIGIEELTQYLNYLKADTATVIDGKQTQGSETCGAGTAQTCLRLHSGAMLRYGRSSAYYFGGSNTTNAIWFDIDPDGAYSGTTNGSGKAIEFWLYYNGRLSSYATINSNTCHNGSTCVNPNSAYDPSWFSW
jgi:prepilin-type N-terminal cleavage/methylation domain-containing protein